MHCKVNAQIAELLLQDSNTAPEVPMPLVLISTPLGTTATFSRAFARILQSMLASTRTGEAKVLRRNPCRKAMRFCLCHVQLLVHCIPNDSSQSLMIPGLTWVLFKIYCCSANLNQTCPWKEAKHPAFSCQEMQLVEPADHISCITDSPCSNRSRSTVYFDSELVARSYYL